MGQSTSADDEAGSSAAAMAFMDIDIPGALGAGNAASGAGLLDVISVARRPDASRVTIFSPGKSMAHAIG